MFIFLYHNCVCGLFVVDSCGTISNQSQNNNETQQKGSTRKPCESETSAERKHMETNLLFKP